MNDKVKHFQDPKHWKDPDIATCLKEAKITAFESMRDYLTQQGKKVEFYNAVELVTIESGGHQLKAVFKPIPDSEALRDAQAEVVAYQASVKLGFPYVPPTVLRTINGKLGSLQLFVDTPRDLLTPGAYQQALQEVPKDDLAQLKVFYFVLGQWDTGPHNLLRWDNPTDGHGYLIAIDNAGIANRQQVRYGELPFIGVAWLKSDTQDFDQSFPFDKVEVMQDPAPENLRKRFADQLPEAFYKNFNSHGQPFCYVAYRNRLWRQYHAFDEQFVKSYTEECSQDTRQALENLKKGMLSDIFSASGVETGGLYKDHAGDILQRCDQVLKGTQES